MGGPGQRINAGGGDGSGGAIFANGALSLTNSTFSQNSVLGASGNQAPPGYGRGGALYLNGTNAVLRYLTVLTNSAWTLWDPSNPEPYAQGGAIYVATNVGATVLGSIFAGNYIASLYAEPTELPGPASAISGPFSDNGWNLVSDSPSGFSASTTIKNADPMLGPLGTHGGSTPVYPLLSGSPAIDAAEVSPATSVDQRGRTRPSGLAADIGAYELADFNIYRFNSVNAGAPVPGGIELIFAGTPNDSYVLEKSTDLVTWSEAGTFTTDANGIFRSNQSGQEEEFFRVRK